MESNNQIMIKYINDSNMGIFIVTINIPREGPYGSQIDRTYTVHVEANSQKKAIEKAISLIKDKVREDHSYDIRASDKTTNGYFEFVKKSFTAFVKGKDSTIDITLLENALKPYPENQSVSV